MTTTSQTTSNRRKKAQNTVPVLQEGMKKTGFHEVVDSEGLKKLLQAVNSYAESFGKDYRYCVSIEPIKMDESFESLKKV